MFLRCKSCFLSLFLLVLSLHAHEKWIVVTTIQYPTAQLKKLAQIEGWRLLVVGDKKTPQDWFLENCDYLSPEKQLSLGYDLAPMLPWNHYSRKNIGYLYAIEHGATIIYDTDDDNEPLDGLRPLLEKNISQSITATNLCVNIYAYFEKPTIWPRGYPLEFLKDSHVFKLLEVGNFIDSNLESNNFDTSNVEIGIEQGLVNGDPDVDAIYRLTQFNNKKIIFTKKPPCILAPGIYCPFNSQNTFFHKKAFFTLYLPSSVSMRVADIWRGYYAQKLMQLSNLALAFSGPSAFQERNSHDLLKDFASEDDLYLKSGKLVKFLSQWNTLHSSDIQKSDNLPSNNLTSDNLKTMYCLFQDLIDNKFLKHTELELLKAWIRDLSKIISR